MLLNILMIVGGIALVLWGADRLTDGAVGIAERLCIPQIIIGLTVVAMGTSMPEFCVSLVSAVKGTPDLAVGNVVGSNVSIPYSSWVLHRWLPQLPSCALLCARIFLLR